MRRLSHKGRLLLASGSFLGLGAVVMLASSSPEALYVALQGSALLLLSVGTFVVLMVAVTADRRIDRRERVVAGRNLRRVK